jgi:hypothetical protein
MLQTRLDSIPPPLEDVPMERHPEESSQKEGDPVIESVVHSFSNMQVLPISYQKYYVNIHIAIGVHVFSLTALVDTGSDINILKKEKIPIHLWETSYGCVTGLGNNDLKLKYEVSQARVLIGNYEIGMRFYVTDAPVDCVLGTPFLSTVTPHGSCNINGKPRYFFTMPAIQGHPCQKIELPFVSKHSWQLSYLHCMVIIKQFNSETGKSEQRQVIDSLPWIQYKTRWKPTWICRQSEIVELGLPGFSRNMTPTVLPPQHILGQMNFPIISSSREKLIDLGDLLRSGIVFIISFSALIPFVKQGLPPMESIIKDLLKLADCL